jgi:hypothetical protein
MSSTTLKSLDNIELRECCTNFANTFSFDGSSDVDMNDLISELSVLQLALPDKTMSAMEIFEYVREVDCYPNISIAYRILFGRKELFKVEVVEKLFKVQNVSRKA